MTGCGCILVDDSYGDATCWERAVTARTTHACSECRGTIRPGERYEYVFGVWDGKPLRFRTCADCLSVRDEFFCETWSYGRIWEDIGDYLLDGGWDSLEVCCLDFLTPIARQRVIRIFDEVPE